MYNKYSEVNKKFLDIRKIVIENKRPRKIEI